MIRALKYTIIKISESTDKKINNAMLVMIAVESLLLLIVIGFSPRASSSTQVLMYDFTIFLMSVVPFLILLAPFIKKQSEKYINIKYSQDIQKILPAKYMSYSSWVHVAMAIENAEKILNCAKENHQESRTLFVYHDNLYNVRPRKLFEGTHYENKLWQNQDEESINRELRNNDIFAALWASELNRSPLLERIAVLYQIDTKEKQELFAKRTRLELVEFFKPVNDFKTLVGEKRKAIKRQEDKYIELEQTLARMKEEEIKMEMDELFDSGMKRLDKLHKVDMKHLSN